MNRKHPENYLWSGSGRKNEKGISSYEDGVDEVTPGPVREEGFGELDSAAASGPLVVAEPRTQGHPFAPLHGHGPQPTPEVLLIEGGKQVVDGGRRVQQVQ